MATPDGKQTMLTLENRPGEIRAEAANSSGSGTRNQNTVDAFPTEVLVRALNDRVERGHDPQGDGPPTYHEIPQ